jgi:hypothetical protein
MSKFYSKPSHIACKCPEHMMYVLNTNANVQDSSYIQKISRDQLISQILYSQQKFELVIGSITARNSGDKLEANRAAEVAQHQAGWGRRAQHHWMGRTRRR